MTIPGLLPLDHPLWGELEGGYREPTAAVDYLKRFETGERSSDLWYEFWGEMYHQEAIGVASLAVVPHLVGHYETEIRPADFFNYLTFVDAARAEGDNPDVPEWLSDTYKSALDIALGFVQSDLKKTTDERTRKSIALFVLQYAGMKEQMHLLDSIENEGHAKTVLEGM